VRTRTLLLAGLLAAVVSAAPANLVPFSPIAAALAQPVSASGTPDGDKKQPPRLPSPSSDDYKLGPGDKLRVEVYKDAQLSQSVQIRPDGKITLPLVGDIEATGKTPLELRDAVGKALKEYMTNPVVTVIVVEASAAIAYVVGEVAKPGTINLQGGPITALQAIAMAGGLKDFANTKNIRILRKGPNGVQTIAFNYKDAIRGDGTAVYLRPGDTIVVPD
jgi:polysaccharide biosynthesis/export protein